MQLRIAEMSGLQADPSPEDWVITTEAEREADVDAHRFGSPLFRAMLDAVPVPEHPAADE